MRVNAITNSVLFVSRILSLAFVCDLLNGIYCSPFYRSIVAQLYQIVVLDFIGGILIYMSSISFIAFTLSRISLIGKDHGKLITSITRISILKFLAVLIPLSILFNIIEVFKHRLNLIYPDNDYPMFFKQAPYYRLKPTLT